MRDGVYKGRRKVKEGRIRDDGEEGRKTRRRKRDEGRRTAGMQGKKEGVTNK